VGSANSSKVPQSPGTERCTMGWPSLSSWSTFSTRSV
jgi:hypothetical protein